MKSSPSGYPWMIDSSSNGAQTPDYGGVKGPSRSAVSRRHSEETVPSPGPRRPPLGRAVTQLPAIDAILREHGAGGSRPRGPDRSSSNSSTSSGLPPTTPVAELPNVILQSAKGSLEKNAETHVLVVEDNDINRALLVQWLKKKGFPLVEAEDGEKAVEAVKNHPPGFFNVILMDMSMPILDGPGAIDAIRKIEKSREVEELSTSISQAIRNPIPAKTGQPAQFQARSRIFALSGLASKEDKLRAFNAGVDGYLVKPVAFSTLTLLFERLGSPQAREIPQ